MPTSSVASSRQNYSARGGGAEVISARSQSSSARAHDHNATSNSHREQYHHGASSANVNDAPSHSSSARSHSSSARMHSTRGGIKAKTPRYFFPAVGDFAVTAIPGYGGYIPGKIAENVIGSTYARSNSLASIAVEERGLENFNENMYDFNPLRFNPRGLDHPSRSIPGYRGFIPGKYADGIFGHVYGRTNNISTLLKRNQYDERDRFYLQGQPE